MPVQLHPNLKARVIYETAEYSQDDILCGEVDHHYDRHNSAKRRRIERIANDYLRFGTAPSIMSARLKRPYINGHRNPWVARSRQKDRAFQEGSASRVDEATRSNHNKSDVQREQVERDSRCRRTTTATVEARDQEINALESTIIANVDGVEGRMMAPITNLATKNRQEESGVTEYFSASAGSQSTSEQRNSTAKDTEWLKRAALLRKENSSKDRDGQAHDTSPIQPQRSRRSRKSQSEDHITNRASSLNAPTKPEYVVLRSMADHKEASSSIISKALPDGIVGFTPINEVNTPDTGIRTDSSVATPPVGATQNNAEVTMQDTATRARRSSARLSGLAAEHGLTASGAGRRVPSRVDVHQLAERCAIASPTPATKAPFPARKQRNTNEADKETAAALASIPALATSITPASSSFTFTRKAKPPPKRKPRPVTFESSPAVLREEEAQDDGLDEAAQCDAEPAKPTPRASLSHVHSSSPPETHDQSVSPTPHGDQASHVSNLSTQAAMAIANAAFQEDAVRSFTVTAETPRPTALILNGTPRLSQPSPAITPFHAFNAGLDGNTPGTALHVPVMSTQDMLAAASPFALSTIKKKTIQRLGRGQRNEGSGLRFAVHLESDGVDARADKEAHVASQTPGSPRVPLKERNSSGVVRNGASSPDKLSQESAFSSPFSSLKLAELSQPRSMGLPELVFETSLDGESPNGRLGFADRFLRNLDGMI